MIANSIENDTADQRQELLEALSRRTKEWAILHRVAQLPIESPDLNAVLDHSLDKVSEAIAVETAAVLFMTEQKQEVIATARGGLSPAFLNQVKQLPTSHSITARVAICGVPIIIEDVSKYPQLVDRAVIQEGLRSIVAVPLKSGGEVIGTLIVAGHNLHNFGSEDIQLLSIISEGLGPVLRSAELYYALRKNR